LDPPPQGRHTTEVRSWRGERRGSPGECTWRAKRLGGFRIGAMGTIVGTCSPRWGHRAGGAPHADGEHPAQRGGLRAAGGRSAHLGLPRPGVSGPQGGRGVVAHSGRAGQCRHGQSRGPGAGCGGRRLPQSPVDRSLQALGVRRGGAGASDRSRGGAPAGVGGVGDHGRWQEGDLGFSASRPRVRWRGRAS
jgi:hypothetical protein